LIAKAEKLETMKAKLRKRAQEAQALIDRALKVGEVQKVELLQDLNIKVLSIVDQRVSPDKANELRKSFAHKKSYIESMGSHSDDEPTKPAETESKAKTPFSPGPTLIRDLKPSSKILQHKMQNLTIH